MIRRVFLISIIVGASLEFGCRLYWKWKGVPIGHPELILEVFYPELRRIPKLQSPRERKKFDILLLGGSVLNRRFGTIEPELKNRFSAALGKPVSIYNLSIPAHTSRDSLLKYSSMGDMKFDLVIVYDGINDFRANNCPANFFKKDYSHFHWYRILNWFHAHPSTYRVALPFTANLIWINIAKKAGWISFLPKDKPRIEVWKDFGFDVKSKESLKSHLEEIYMISKSRNEQLVLMTFAYYIPENYSLERFRARSLDYFNSISPIEIWGDPRYVKLGLDGQNQVIKDLVSSHENIIFVDQKGRIPIGGRWFNDICHLTNAGCELFSKNIVQEVVSRLKTKEKFKNSLT